MWSNGKSFEVDGLGYQSPKPIPCEELAAGEVGFLFANIKTVSDAQIGDTITDQNNPAAEALPGFEPLKPMVFAGLFPTDSDQYPELRDALERLKLNDGALFYEPETSQALGFGFRCGFLGLLHMEIVRERLEREFDLDLLVTHYGESDRLFRNDGDGQFVDATGALGLASFDTGCAWGDMDGDGDPDLYVANEGDGNHLYRNLQTTGNHWLQVRLAGTTSNRAGIGAQVRIVSGGVVQMRELSGGSGLGSQDALVAAFGLGGRTAIGLCRCGQSQNKPFCDGAHRAAGFADAVVARELPPPKV